MPAYFGLPSALYFTNLFPSSRYTSVVAMFHQQFLHVAFFTSISLEVAILEVSESDGWGNDVLRRASALFDRWRFPGCRDDSVRSGRTWEWRSCSPKRRVPKFSSWRFFFLRPTPDGRSGSTASALQSGGRSFPRSSPSRGAVTRVREASVTRYGWSARGTLLSSIPFHDSVSVTNDNVRGGSPGCSLVF